MKKYQFLILIIFFAGCKLSKDASFSKASKQIYKKQKKEKYYAPSAFLSRKLFINKIKQLNYNVSDTLFLIERIGDPSLEVWSNIWTSKRDMIYEYEKDSEIFKDTVINYKTWQNRYKTNVEKFDTTDIDKHHILGGYKTFITQVIQGKQVKTFFFHDSYSGFILKK